jgi:hypothetical protein
LLKIYDATANFPIGRGHDRVYSTCCVSTRFPKQEGYIDQHVMIPCHGPRNELY